jgi:hypothetical protein
MGANQDAATAPECMAGLAIFMMGNILVALAIAGGVAIGVAIGVDSRLIGVVTFVALTALVTALTIRYARK